MRTDWRPVAIVGLPVEVHHRALEHMRTIRREMAVLAAGGVDLPPRLRALSGQLQLPYEQFGDFHPALLTALATGAPTLDVHAEVPPSAADVAEELALAMDEVDEFCRAGTLVSLVAAPEVVAYRSWFLGEFVRQVRHREPPRPFTPSRDASDAVRAGGNGASATVVVHGDLDLEGAEAVRSAIAEAVGRGSSTIVLDLADCTFIDSVGVSVLLTTWVRLAEGGGRLALANLTDRVRATLVHAGVHDLLTTGGT